MINTRLENAPRLPPKQIGQIRDKKGSTTAKKAVPPDNALIMRLFIPAGSFLLPRFQQV